MISQTAIAFLPVLQSPFICSALKKGDLWGRDTDAHFCWSAANHSANIWEPDLHLGWTFACQTQFYSEPTFYVYVWRMNRGAWFFSAVVSSCSTDFDQCWNLYVEALQRRILNFSLGSCSWSLLLNFRTRYQESMFIPRPIIMWLQKNNLSLFPYLYKISNISVPLESWFDFFKWRNEYLSFLLREYMKEFMKCGAFLYCQCWQQNENKTLLCKV